MKLDKIFGLVLATFCAWSAAAAKYDVSIRLVGDPGETKPVPVKQYEAGKKVTLTVAPEAGRYVTRWATGTEAYPGVGKSFSFTMPEKPVSFTVSLRSAHADAWYLGDVEPELRLASSSTGASKSDGVVTGQVGGYLHLLYQVPLQQTSKLTAKFEGLPKGLKVTPTYSVATVGTHGEVCAYPAWQISGVPTEPINVERTPAFALLTNEGKTTTAFTLPLTVVEKQPTKALAQGTAYAALDPVKTLGLPVHTPITTTVWVPKSGLPAGLKADKTTGVVSGTPTKPGVYYTTYTRTKTIAKAKYTESAVVKFKVESSVANKGLFGNPPGLFISILGTVEGRNVAAYFQNVTAPKMAGLPPGLKFDAKTMKITGATTKVGSYAVTLSGKTAGGKQTAEYTVFWDVGTGGKALAGSEMEGCILRTVVGQRVEEAEFSEHEFSVLAGAKVAVSGLPAGIKFVKTGTAKRELGLCDIYELVGYTTAAKQSVFTLKITMSNGMTETRRYLYVVRPFLGAGTLLGRFEPQHDYCDGDFVAGEASIVIAANGSAKAVLSDGKEKLTLNFKSYSGDPATDINEFTTSGAVHYETELPETKTSPARRVRFTIEQEMATNPYNGRRETVLSATDYGCEILGETDSSYDRAILLGQRWDEAHEDVETSDGSTLCTHDSDFILKGAVADVFAVNSASRATSLGGYVTVARSSTYAAKASGRTPDGLAFSNKAVSYCFNNANDGTFPLHIAHTFWSPFTVYNKTTGNTWLYTCYARGARVDLVPDAGAFQPDFSNFDNVGSVAGYTYANDSFVGEGYKTFPALALRDHSFDNWTKGFYGASISVCANGQLSTVKGTLAVGQKGADMTATYKPATLQTTFTHDGWTYEVFPVTEKPGVFGGIRYRKEGAGLVCQPVRMEVNPIDQPV